MGEKSLIKVMDSIYRNGLELSDIKGISFKTNDEIKRNDDDRFLDINSFATPQYAILSDEKYWIIPQKGRYKNFNSFLNIIIEEYSYILTGRGCPFRCAFCVEGNSKNKYVYRSLPNLKNDLKYFLSITKAKYVAFADDTFTSSPKRVSELCSMIKEVQKEFYNFIWFAEGRVDILSKHLEMIGMMYDAGLRKLQLGIESGRQETLNIYNKGINLDQIERVIKESSKYELLTVYGNIMMANPQESFSDFLPTIDFFEKLLDLSDFKFDIGFSYLAPFVGTPIRLNPQKYGIDILIKDFEFKASAMDRVICKSNKMTLLEVYSLRQLAHVHILAYCKNKIFKMPANRIISLFKIAKQNYSNVTILSVFNLLPSFSRYFTFAISEESIFIDNQNDYINYCPLRLWDLEYTSEMEYSFTALDGEKSTLKDIDKQLWELASGKNTVSEIYQIINYNKVSCLEIDYILSFYKSLENKLALLFRKY
jgi:radical SAM superfamily enzyme YgiQ (UPF0313 family)